MLASRHATARPVSSLLLSLAVLAALVAAAALPNTALAACPDTSTLPGSTFEGCDGNLEPSTASAKDWTSFSPFSAVKDAVSGSNDGSLFVAGTKEEDPSGWSWEAGSAPGKTDFFSAASFAEAASSNVFFYFGFQRAPESGATFSGIELNQLDADYTSKVTKSGVRTTNLPRRSEGDLLLTYDGNFSSGVVVGACRWHGDADSGTWYDYDSTTFTRAGNTCKALTGDAQGGINGATIPSATGATGFQFPILAGGFGEASVNITKALRATPTTCFNFGSVWVHSRSSSSLTSNMQDLIEPVPLTTASCAIKIVKQQKVRGVGTFVSTPVTAYVDDVLDYRMLVTNAGSVTLSTVAVTDPKCGTPAYVSGDVNSNDKLETTETWTYTCSHTVAAADLTAGSTYVNTATANAKTGDPTRPDVEPNVSSVTANLVSSSLAISKTQTTTPAVATSFTPDAITIDAGQAITYRITVTNTGSTTLKAIDVTDANCAIADPTAATELAPGVPMSFTCTRSTDAASNVTPYVNTASARATDPAGRTVQSPDATVTANARRSLLTVDKQQRVGASGAYTPDTVTATAGDTLGYQLTVTNGGNTTLTGVVPVDEGCSGITPAAVTLIAGASQVFTCEYGTSASSNAPSYTNVATATGRDPLNRVVNAAPDSVTAQLRRLALSTVKEQTNTPDTATSFTGDPIDVTAGQWISYRILVSNTGNTDVMAVANDTGCTTPSPASQTIAVGATETFTCSFLTDAASNAPTKLNTASATGTAGGRTTTSNEDTVTANLKRLALTTVKEQTTTPATDASFTGDPIDVTAGQTISYRILVTNTGNTAVTAVANDTGCTTPAPASQTIAVGDTETFTCSFLTDATSNVLTKSNTAAATGTADGRSTTSNEDTVTANLKRLALSTVKEQTTTPLDATSFTGDPIDVTAGQTISYRIVVTNTGNTAVTAVANDTGCTTPAPESQTIAVGDTETFNCSFLTDATSNVDTKSNTASATGTAGGRTTTSNEDTVTANLKRLALSTVKEQTTTPATGSSFTGDPIDVTAGQTISYRILVTNTGNTAVTAVANDTGCTTPTPESQIIAAGDTETFTCSYETSATSNALTHDNTASATGTAGGRTTTSNEDAVTANLKRLALSTVKEQTTTPLDDESFTSDPIDVTAGQTISYRILVTNTGNTAVTAVANDTGCTTPAPASQLIAVGDTETFTCSFLTDATSNVDTKSNTASATGTAGGRTTTSNEDTVTANLSRLALSTVKEQTTTPATGSTFTGDAIDVTAGQTISYRILVTNTGNTTVTAVANDTGCTTPVPASQTIAAGDTETFTCSFETSTTSNSLTHENTASATGTAGERTTTSNEDTVVANLKRLALTTAKEQTTTPATEESFTGDPIDVAAGQTISYRILVTNTGNTAVTAVANDIGCTTPVPASQTIAVDATETFTCSYETSATSNALTHDNTASATGTADGRTTTSNEDTVTANLTRLRLETVKEQTTTPADGDSYTGDAIDVTAGQTIGYRILVTNTGNADVVASANDTGCSGPVPASQPIAVGDTETFTCSFLTDATSNDLTHDNTASATGTAGARTTTSNEDTVTANLKRLALSTMKEQTVTPATATSFTGDPIDVTAGQTISYRILVTNTGNTAVTAVANDTGCTTPAPASQTIAVGDTETFTCSFLTDATSNVLTKSNTASATGTAGGRSTTSNEDTVTANLRRLALSTVKEQTTTPLDDESFTSDPIDVTAGQTISYRILVTNTGNTAVATVANDVGCTTPSPESHVIEAGNTATFTCSFATDATSNTPIHTNTASATGTADGRTTTSNDDTVVANLNRLALTTVKEQTTTPDDASSFTGDPVVAYAGQTLSYSILVTNAGNTDVVASANDTGCTGLAPKSQPIAVGATATFTCIHATDAASNDPAYSNTASATGMSGARTTTSNEDTVTASLRRLALTAAKEQTTTPTDDGSFTGEAIDVVAGTTISYRISASNTGNTALTVRATDLGCDGPQPSSQVIAAGNTGTFVCQHPTDADSNETSYTNTASATGSDGTRTVTTADDSVVANLRRLQLTTTKLQSTNGGENLTDGVVHVQVGDTITYRVDITNDGNVPTTVTPRDENCTIAPADAAPELLQPQTTRSFTCTAVATAADAGTGTTPGTRVNTAFATGTDSFGGTVRSNDDSVTAIVHSLSLSLDKQQSTDGGETFTDEVVNVRPLDTLTYRIAVTNTGNTAQDVTVTDAKCSALVGPGGADGVADPIAAGDTLTYTCSHGVVAADEPAYTNTAVATGSDAFGGSSTSNEDSVSANVLISLISVDKRVFDRESETWSETNRAHVGDTIEFRVLVTNPGNNTITYSLEDLKCPVMTELDTDSVKRGEATEYTCRHVVTDADGDSFVNVVELTGTDSIGEPVTGTSATTTTILKPAFTVAKLVRVAGSGAAFSSGASAHVGDTLEYQITVVNTGNTRLTFDLVDPACGTISSNAPVGLDGTDDVIAAGASVTYTCTHVVGPLDPNPYINVVRATGTDDLGLETPKEARVDAAVLVAGLTVDKQVRNATAGRGFADSGRGVVGDRLEFQHTVTNTGNVALVVDVADDRCSGLTGPAGFDGVDDTITPGQQVVYTCSHVLTAADPNPYVNVVVVRGTDTIGGTTSATDTASVTVEAVPVAAAGAPPAAARLTPPSGCQRGSFRVSVNGTNIRTVQFYVDGRLRQTVRRATRGRWIGVLSTRGLRPGTHRVRARVTFTAATGVRPRLLNARVGVCRPAAVLPAFTG